MQPLWLVPKAAANLDYFLETRKHQIWFSGESGNVKPIAEAHAVTNLRTVISGEVCFAWILRMFSERRAGVSLSVTQPNREEDWQCL